MTGYTFTPAKRENMPLLLGVAGGTGSGKTYSALLLARGLAGGKPFAMIDTENGRALHYAELFPEMRHTDIRKPFRPEKYADAIEAADKEGFPVIVVDSMSHEWSGDGGCIDWHDEIMGNDFAKNFMAWIEPKKQHKKMVTRLLQVKAHVILCFRAEPKTEVIDDPKQPGKKLYVEKRSITGLDGWIPISEKMLPYELTASFLLMADRPGFPKPIKLQEQHKPMVPLDKPLSEETGRRLAEWAKGSNTTGRAGADTTPQADRVVPPGNVSAGSQAGHDPGKPATDVSGEGASGSDGDGDDIPFADGSATVPSPDDTMTLNDFRQWCDERNITPDKYRPVGARLFPDKALSRLTQRELAELRDALTEQRTAEAVGA